MMTTSSPEVDSSGPSVASDQPMWDGALTLWSRLHLDPPEDYYVGIWTGAYIRESPWTLSLGPYIQKYPENFGEAIREAYREMPFDNLIHPENPRCELRVAGNGQAMRIEGKLKDFEDLLGRLIEVSEWMSPNG